MEGALEVDLLVGDHLEEGLHEGGHPEEGPPVGVCLAEGHFEGEVDPSALVQRSVVGAEFVEDLVGVREDDIGAEPERVVAYSEEGALERTPLEAVEVESEGVGPWAEPCEEEAFEVEPSVVASWASFLWIWMM